MPKEDKTVRDDKLAALRASLNRLNGLLVAFSGGVDSTFLLAVAVKELRGPVLAVTAASELYPEWERGEARRFAEQLGADHRVIETSELDIPNFADNPPDRCYLCKSELFDELGRIAEQEGISAIADGTNADDSNDYRPGRKAARERGVMSPLLEAGLSKNEIRTLSREMQLPTWDKGSFACLASRFPHGSRISAEKIKQVEEAETYLRNAGFRQFRVRHHENMARIEVDPTDIPRLLGELRRDINDRFKEIGFKYVTVDLEGYRTGSMNPEIARE